MADTLEPVMNAHRLIVAAELVRKDATHPELRRQVFYQMTRLTRDKGALQHDDRLDALSMAVGYWVEAMARDVEVAAKDSREEAVDRMLDEFLESVLGPKPKEHTWAEGFN